MLDSSKENNNKNNNESKGRRFFPLSMISCKRHSGSIEDAFTSGTQFQRYSWERVEREDRKVATNLRRSASTFYVVSSVLFVLRNVIVPANANRNEFLIVFDAVYTFICLARFSRPTSRKRSA